MPINNNDGYEKLAKLLYPSIEASGNVYYGQTRKLTLDELFDKNDLGYEAHIETFSANNEYTSYFNWKIGPLHGAVKIIPIGKDENDNPIPMTKANFPGSKVYRVHYGVGYEEVTSSTRPIFGVIFAKYKLEVSSEINDNVTYAGNFKTYDKNVNCEYKGIYYYTADLIKNYDNYDYNNRNFFVEKNDSDLNYYLYVQIAFYARDLSDLSEYYTDEEKNEPLTFMAMGESSTISIDNADPDNPVLITGTSFYKYKKNNNSWETYNPGDYITLNDGDKVSFSAIITDGSDSINIVGTSGSKHIIIKMTGQLAVYGNIFSIKYMYNNNNGYTHNLSNNAFKEIFRQCNSLLSAEHIILPCIYDNQHGFYSYGNIFFECTNLKSSPCIICDKLPIACFAGAYSSCTNLKYTQDILVDEINARAFENLYTNCSEIENFGFITIHGINNINWMYKTFKGCTSLKNITLIYGGLSQLTQLANPSASNLSTFKDVFTDCNNIESITFIAEDYNCPDGVDDSDTWFSTVFSTFLPSFNDNKVRTLYIRHDATDDEFNNVDTYIKKNGWNVERLTEDEENAIYDTAPKIKNGFCCKLSPLDEEHNKLNYIITSGSDSDWNGRGKLKDTTLFNMKTTFDPDNYHHMNEFNNNDGSFNQEIWGYKSFNSPVQFRNGIYGEGFSLVSYDPNTSDFLQGSNITNRNGLKLSTSYVYNNSSENKAASSNLILGYTSTGLDNANSAAKLVASCNSEEAYIMPAVTDDGTLQTITIQTKGNIIPATANIDDLGSADSKFNNIYNNNIYTNNVTCDAFVTANNSITVKSNVTPENNTIKLGNANNIFNELNCKNINNVESVEFRTVNNSSNNNITYECSICNNDGNNRLIMSRNNYDTTVSHYVILDPYSSKAKLANYASIVSADEFHGLFLPSPSTNNLGGIGIYTVAATPDTWQVGKFIYRHATDTHKWALEGTNAPFRDVNMFIPGSNIEDFPEVPSDTTKLLLVSRIYTVIASTLGYFFAVKIKN